MPIPSFVIMADVADSTRNSSDTNFKTCTNGVVSGTLSTLKGNFGSDVSVILKVTLAPAEAMLVMEMSGFKITMF